MAHNTITTDGKNQPRTTNSDLLAFYDKPELKLAAAETDEAPPGTKWIRAILLADNYAVIWDDLHRVTKTIPMTGSFMLLETNSTCLARRQAIRQIQAPIPIPVHQ